MKNDTSGIGCIVWAVLILAFLAIIFGIKFWAVVLAIVAIIFIIVFLIGKSKKNNSEQETENKNSKIDSNYSNTVNTILASAEKPITEKSIQGPIEANPEKILVIDTETTGLKSNDEILQLSIINWDEKIILDELFKPANKTRWTEASKINGIYPRHVKDQPSFYSKSHDVCEILQAADVLIGYNVQFDLNMLSQNGASINPKENNIKIIDVMGISTEAYGYYNSYFDNKKWIKLTDSIERSGIETPENGNAHNSLYDAICTLRLYKELSELGYTPEDQKVNII